MASSTIKTNFGKFDGKDNFSLWQQRMKDPLVQNIIYKILTREKSKKISTEEWKKLEEIAFSMIYMCLSDEVLPEINMKTISKGYWQKLENSYMGKNMINKLWLKKQLYSLWMPEGGDLIFYI